MSEAKLSMVDWSISSVVEVEALTVATQPTIEGAAEGVEVVGILDGIELGTPEGADVLNETQQKQHDMKSTKAKFDTLTKILQQTTVFHIEKIYIRHIS